MPKRRPVPVPPPSPCQSTRLLIDGKSDVVYDHPCVDGSTIEGIRAIRSMNVTLISPTVRNCAGAGILDYGYEGLVILDPMITGNGRGFLYDSAGKDTQGSGIIIQGKNTVIRGGSVSLNGNDTTYEHGVYISKLADNAAVSGLMARGNAASGIKIAGDCWVDDLQVSDSPRGIVYASLQPGQEAGIYNSGISGTMYAIMVEMGASLTGYSSDYNRYAKGSKFRLPDGRVVGLSSWKAYTGLDQHSVEV